MCPVAPAPGVTVSSFSVDCCLFWGQKQTFPCAAFGLLCRVPRPPYSLFSFSIVQFGLPPPGRPLVCLVTPHPLPSFPYGLRPSAMAFPSWEPSRKVRSYPLGSDHHHLISLLLHPAHFPCTFICIWILKYIYRPALIFLNLYNSNIFFRVKINKVGSTSSICTYIFFFLH